MIICLWFSVRPLQWYKGCHCLALKLFRKAVESPSAVVLLGIRMGINHSSSCLIEGMCNVQRCIILLSFTVSSKCFLMCLFNFVLYMCELHPYIAIGSSPSLNFCIELNYVLSCSTVISFGYMSWVVFKTSTLIFSKKGPLCLHTF